MSDKHNQNGFTLLEVLISITLLFIIITSFLGFFTQSAIFNQKNKQKMETSQVAQEVVNLIDEQVTKSTLEQNAKTTNVLKAENTFLEVIDDDPNHNLNVNQLIYPQTIITPFKIKLELKNNQTSQKLIQIKVIVIDPKNTSDQSETYTYIRR